MRDEDSFFCTEAQALASSKYKDCVVDLKGAISSERVYKESDIANRFGEFSRP